MMSARASSMEWVLRAIALSNLVFDSIWRRKWLWMTGISALLGFNHWFTLGINASQSLPNHAFLVLKQDHGVTRGDYVTFRWHGGGPYLPGVKFTKIVRGVPGDVVSRQGNDLYINGEFVSTAKPRATTGQPLLAGPVGVIPEGRYYVHATNKDSLDSRYAITGWISREAIVGKALPLF
jgi:conjugal transfer pilin signal peptidase TrbI